MQIIKERMSVETLKAASFSLKVLKQIRWAAQSRRDVKWALKVATKLYNLNHAVWVHWQVVIQPLPLSREIREHCEAAHSSFTQRSVWRLETAMDALITGVVVLFSLFMPVRCSGEWNTYKYFLKLPFLICCVSL